MGVTPMPRLLDAFLNASLILGPLVLAALWVALWYKLSDGAWWGIPFAFLPLFWAIVTALFYFGGESGGV